jgi:GNAT superfamily N-acetyltransferase
MALTIRRAAAGDFPAILALLMDDDLGKLREDLHDPAYDLAFAAIDGDANQLLGVAMQDHAVIGCFQLTFIPGLARRGLWRGQIEAVRVARAWRGQGIGAAMMQWAIARCRARGCGLVQLTSDKRRADAHRFYSRLGFTASHEGMKLPLV